jgi:type VI secretion system protein ImpA
MAVDFEVLGRPLSPTDPCGVDLELAGDTEYLNFVAAAEGVLPKSYFGRDASGNEGRPFDRSQIQFDVQFDNAKRFFEKTRDLRLIGIVAKLCILNRDFTGFSACIRAINSLLTNQWDNVHPRAEDGEFGLRAVTVEALETMPTIVLPLQFLPLVQHNRLGSLSYRSVLISQGEARPTEGEDKVDPASVEKILSEVELETLRTVRQQFVDLDTAVKQIQSTWINRCPSGPSINIERFASTVSQIFGLLDSAVEKRSPSPPPEPTSEGEAAGQGQVPGGAKPQSALASGRITSTAQATRALAAVATYFGRNEPSNPALMVVRQAEALIGKSFLEVLKVLVPDQVAKAAVNIGRDQFFPMPVERLAAASGSAVVDANPSGDSAGQITIEIQTRLEALAVLDQVGGYFRVAEPSSPIPFLTDRAKDLAQRDFLNLLTTILPANTLKSS